MDSKQLLTGRRSVRKFTDEKVNKETMNEIMEMVRWSPSWGNTQSTRYTLVEDLAVIEKLANDGVKGFVYNIDTLKKAKGVAVISCVAGKSGVLPESYNVTPSDNYRTWEIFDAGLSCQTFCLAAHSKGIGTCIMGVINEESIAQIIDLPKEEIVVALVVYGYINEEAKAPQRLAVEEISRYM